MEIELDRLALPQNAKGQKIEKLWSGAALCLAGSILLHLGIILAFVLTGSLSLGMEAAGTPFGEVMMVALFDAPPGKPDAGDNIEAGGAEGLSDISKADDDPSDRSLFDPPEPEALAIAVEKKQPQKIKKKSKPKDKAEKSASGDKSPESRKQAEAAGSARGQGGGQTKGGGGSAANYGKNHLSYITKHIQRKMIYPDEAKRQGIRGTARIAFTIGTSGQPSNIRIRQSSGSNLLDQAALNAVKRASPFPPPPASVNVSIPLVFNLK